MARSAEFDTLEKFRFDVVFFDNQGLSSVSLSNQDSFVGGFTEVTLPKSVTKERTYRENIDPLMVKKAAGLTTFEPMTFRKGKVQVNEAFTKWQQIIVNSAAFISPITTIVSDTNFIPVYEADYRKDLLLRIYDRNGKVRKAYFIFNAFPIKYNPGDMNSMEDGKVIEDLVVTYENFVELKNDEVDSPN